MSVEYHNVIPDEIEMKWTEDSLMYRERRYTDDSERAKQLCRGTAAIMTEYADMLDEIDGVHAELDYTIKDKFDSDGYITVEVKVTPGHPGGSRSIVLASIATELMTLLGMQSSDLWRTVVETTTTSVNSNLDVEFLVDTAE